MSHASVMLVLFSVVSHSKCDLKNVDREEGSSWLMGRNVPTIHYLRFYWNGCCTNVVSWHKKWTILSPMFNLSKITIQQQKRKSVLTKLLNVVNCILVLNIVFWFCTKYLQWNCKSVLIFKMTFRKMSHHNSDRVTNIWCYRSAMNAK